MSIGDYCKETLDQLPQNWKDVVTEYKEAIAGKDIGAVLQDWFEIVKKDYLNFDGTVSRKDYAVYFLPALIICIIPVIGQIASLALLLPNIGFGIRRLNDLKLPVWLILMPIIPIIGLIALLLVFLRNK